jgi:homoserine kinase
MPTEPIEVVVPGSTSNLGPGFDVLGMALDRALTARWEPGPDSLVIVGEGTLTLLDVSRDLVHRSLAEGLGVDPSELGGRLRLTSAIPIARGMGSSAAARVAGRVLALATLRPPDDSVLGHASGSLPVTAAERGALIRAVTRSEGHPDNAVPSLVGGLVATSLDGDDVRWTPLPLSPSVGFVFAAPGMEIRTDEARIVLPATVPHADAVSNVGRIAELLIGLARADGERIAWGLHDRLHMPWRWPLVPLADRARAAALDAGAWGVTLSGSGSGVMALGPRSACTDIAEALDGVFAEVEVSGERCAFEVRPVPVGATVVRD